MLKKIPFLSCVQKILLRKALTCAVLLLLFFFHSAYAQEVKESDFFLTAKQTYQEGSYELSKGLFEQFIKQFPESQAVPEAKLYIGQCLCNLEKFPEARNILVELEKNYTPYAIEDRLLFWLGQIYLKVKDNKEAVNYFKKLINNFPNSELTPKAKMQVGYMFFEEGNYNKARDVFGELSQTKDLVLSREALFKKGQSQYNAKDYKNAFETFSFFAQVFLNSENLDKANFYLGQSSFYLGGYENAIKYYSEALKLSEDDLIKVASLEGLGWSYLNENKLNDAKEVFLRLEDFSNAGFNKENALYGMATLYFKLSDWEKAVNYYDKLITDYPESELIAKALFAKAQALAELLKFQDAAEGYKKIIGLAEKKPDSVADVLEKAHYNLGWLYYKTGQADLAAQEFRLSIGSKDKETGASAMYQLGEMFLENKENDKAIEMFLRLLNEFPYNPYNDFALYKLGIAYLNQGNNKEAIDIFKKFNTQYSQSALLDAVNYNLGYAYFQNKEFAQAKSQLESFLNVFRESDYRDEAMLLLASALYRQGLLKEAADIYLKIEEEFKGDQDLLERAEYNIALILFEQGQEKEAVGKYIEFVEKFPKSPFSEKIMFWLGQYYFSISDYDSAKKYFEQIVRGCPDSDLLQEARYQLGLIFIEEANTERAKQIFKAILSEKDYLFVKPKVMLAIGELLWAEGNSEEALNNYKELIFLVESEGFKDELNSKVSQNQENDSKQDWPQQIKSRALVRIGDIYKQKKMFTEAINYYQNALENSKSESRAEIEFKIAESQEEGYNLKEAQKDYLNIEYVYEQDKPWVVKGLLRAAKIYEDGEFWQEALDTYQKILNYDVDEVKFAKERIKIINDALGQSSAAGHKHF